SRALPDRPPLGPALRRCGGGLRQGVPSARTGLSRRSRDLPRRGRRRPHGLLLPARDAAAEGCALHLLLLRSQDGRGPHGRDPRARRGPVPVADIAASFEQAVVDVLVTKSLRAVRERDLDTLVIVGG